ncbi:HAMP domain-containing sensor histidine kinase [Williamsia sp.]|uniref:sensor histidine kinase n=1 Tax=Williamsia sp. TaxID=1872085 RepID=UPI001A2D320B|nr:HAMP domain-containing sensor histidine kinase [Williamsia sp.]MBJ7290981.1 HAMP domain-containing protein [Williamsia sp.]
MGDPGTVSNRLTWLRRRLAGVRIRLTVIATLLLAVALALAAAIMLFVLHESLLNAADGATSARAGQIAQALQNESPATIDVQLLAPSDDVDAIQIVSPDGTVLAGTPNARQSPLSGGAAPGARRTVDDARMRSGDDEYRGSVLGVTTPGGPLTVIVGAAEGPINDVVLTVAVLFCVVFPVILLMLAAAVHYVVGRTLRPVEQIRSQVASMSSSDLSRRVSEPDTGDEIATLASTMNQMLDRLQSARERQLHFVGDASHELRSPLMTIVGMLDLARTSGRPLDTDTIDTVVLPEAHRLQTMVDDLLLLARADENGVPLTVEDVDLDDIVDAEARRLERLGRIRVHADVEAIRVRGDRDKLTRAVRNLADNAARHALDCVEISMSSDSAAGTASVTISDDGQGIPEPDRQRVFQRFVRLDTDRQRSRGGSGLGLAIVAEIVHAHDGDVRVDEAVGGGAAVTVVLPLPGADQADEPPSAASR